LPFAGSTFDFATAFMAIMGIPDPGLAIGEAARVLRPGGFFQFSILHPCFVPPHRRVVRDGEGRTTHVELARYYDNIDGEPEVWKFSAAPREEQEKVEPFRIQRFHRTLSQWVSYVVAAGLVIEQLNEPSATEKLAASFPILEDTLQFPLSLIVRARKPA
jgi:ubiquinone/menaquinone biosynthesis C-methylase UbiE